MLLSCNGRKCFYCNNYLSFTNYNVDNYQYYTTNKGSIVYQSTFLDNEILESIDQKIDELEDCLELSIKRTEIHILIPNDWFISPCSGQQLLPYNAPEALCEQKGIKPTQDCPCMWRVALQDNWLIVTPPNLLLFKAELTRLVTGINNPWLNNEISKCLI
jgi:hypothetical protein